VQPPVLSRPLMAALCSRHSSPEAMSNLNADRWSAALVCAGGVFQDDNSCHRNRIVRMQSGSCPGEFTILLVTWFVKTSRGSVISCAFYTFRPSHDHSCAYSNNALSWWGLDYEASHYEFFHFHACFFLVLMSLQHPLFKFLVLSSSLNVREV
jgi:hypothetical protein